jgi:hypothetical protein
MGMDPQIFHKTHVDHGRVARRPEPEPERRGPVFEIRGGLRMIVVPTSIGGAPTGSVDLAALGYPPDDVENWGKAARIQDVCATIESTVVMLVKSMTEVIGDELRDVDAELADARKEFAAQLNELQQENRDLRGSIAEMRGEIQALGEIQADLERRVRQARAVRGSRRKSRGATDGAAA